MSFIKIVSRDYIGDEALLNVINYCLRYEKQYVERYGAGVVDNNLQNIVNGFEFIKRYYHKTEGKQLHHFVICIYRYKKVRDKKDWEIKQRNEREACKYIALEIPCFVENKGFQNCSFIHEDSDYIHIHLIVNSVSWRDGKKLTNVKSFANDILKYLKENYSYLSWEGIIL